MAKATTKTIEPPTDVKPIGQMLRTAYLVPSPTNPRKRFPQSSIEELATSITEQGIIEPLIVRLAHPDQPGISAAEIICGERRWRAATHAGLEFVPCIIRDLTDDQVLDIQIHENLHREDVHPMDEAYGYQFLKDKLGCTNEELALRVGKSEKFVAQRLKLNSLIEEAQADIEAGHLPLVYALEIAKYAQDAQKIILAGGVYQQESKYEKNTWVYYPIKGQLKPWADFVAYIHKNILWQLSAAPFDRKATNLRPDGLACVVCPDRTGANAGLFDASLIDKKDSCLNPTCFTAKSQQFVVVTRERIAHDESLEVTSVPLIHSSDWSDKNEVVGRQNFTFIGKKPKNLYCDNSEKACENQVKAVDLNDSRFGKVTAVCLRSSGCKTHYPGVKASAPLAPKNAEKEREKELIKKRERREEIVDCYVSDAVRKRVFRLAGEKFADTFTVAGEGPDTFIAELLTKLWFTSNSDIDSNTRSLVVQTLMRDAMDDPKALQDSYRPYGSADTQTSGYSTIVAMSDRNQKLMLFLLTHGNKGQTYSGNYRSQLEVRALAEYYGVDYRLLDAEERLKWAEDKAKKHVPAFKLYLDAVRNGDATAKIPRPYADTYKPKD
ncbi:hypothetical protein BH10ACI2_BH10ACI2_00410 [soil metagenome]